MGNGTESDLLNPDKALLFRITHRNNLAWILDHGLISRNREPQDPDFVTIGSEDLIDKRAAWALPVGPGDLLGDYVPFYFTPWSPMLLNLLTGRGVRQRDPEEIVFIVTSLHLLERNDVPYLISDRHAYLRTANFFQAREDLKTVVPWTALQNRDFKKDPLNPEAFDRYQAEALAYDHVPVTALLGLACYTDAVKAQLDQSLEERGIDLPNPLRPGWYFR